MPSIEDWINNPLGIIETLFENHKNFESSNVRNYFTEKMKTKNAVQWVPSLNDTPQHDLKANSLVRFRCMIQDMYDPEFYLGTYQVKDDITGNTFMKSGKYKDIAQCGVNQSINVEARDNITMDRMTLYCVPVPGESEWVKMVHADQCRLKTKCFPSTSRTPVRYKRAREDDEMMIDENGTPLEGATAGGDDSGMTNGANPGISESPLMTEHKRQQTEPPGSQQFPGIDLNFPLPGEEGPACLVKVYDDLASFKVNDIVEFVGVFSVDPALARFDKDSEEGEVLMSVVEEEPPEETQAHSPPPSLVPRLHAVLHNTLDHVNPLVPGSKTDDFKVVLESVRSDLSLLRESLLSVLEHALLGDKLAAEYMLCHLMAYVYGRADVMPLGKYSLNLTNCPKSSSYADLLHHLISNLITQSFLLKMSLHNMNKLKFSPYKDYTANRLCSGVLQLADKTNLVIDETALEPGQLDVNGVKNIQALGNLISWQKVEYDFNYHRQDFLSNVSSLVLSEGKSILPSDCLLPLRSAIIMENIRDYFALLDPKLTDDFLTKCRTYIGLARSLPYALSDEMQKVIQEDFVKMRKDDPKSLTVDDFHALLSLTRLLSLSHLQEGPSQELWARAIQLEKERKARVAQMPTRPQPSEGAM